MGNESDRSDSIIFYYIIISKTAVLSNLLSETCTDRKL